MTSDFLLTYSVMASLINTQSKVQPVYTQKYKFHDSASLLFSASETGGLSSQMLVAFSSPPSPSPSHHRANPLSTSSRLIKVGV